MVDRHATTFFSRDLSVSLQPSTLFCLVHLTDSASYVAMHAMQEGELSSHDVGSGANGYSDGSMSQRKHAHPQMRETLATMVGMLLPLLTQFGHHH
jgi:hypothetical protein